MTLTSFTIKSHGGPQERRRWICAPQWPADLRAGFGPTLTCSEDELPAVARKWWRQRQAINRELFS
jgi:hypothetical protein